MVIEMVWYPELLSNYGKQSLRNTLHCMCMGSVCGVWLNTSSWVSKAVTLQQRPTHTLLHMWTRPCIFNSLDFIFTFCSPGSMAICLQLKKKMDACGRERILLVMFMLPPEKAPASATSHSSSVNLQITRWNQRNLLKRLPVKSHDK